MTKAFGIPSAPINHRLQDVVPWTREPRYAPARLEEYLAWTLILPEIPQESDTVEEMRSIMPEFEMSYVGGGSLLVSSDSWPRNADGTALAHVMTVSLSLLSQGHSRDLVFQSVPGAKAWLPSSGTLEIFHDLETYGWDLLDKGRGGWKIVYVDQPQKSLDLDYGPDDLEVPNRTYGQLHFNESTIMLPNPLDVASLDPDAFDAATAAYEQYMNMWMVNWLHEPSHDPLMFTHVYGRSLGGEDGIRGVIEEMLPLTIDGDSHVLVFDICSQVALEGWFGDGHPLEVWMRASDLETRSFDQAWCVIRSDC